MLLAKAGAVQVLFQVLCVTTTKAMQALRGSYVDLKKKKRKKIAHPYIGLPHSWYPHRQTTVNSSAR
ncbi:hypothetical protein ACKS23_10557 [Histoplasma ohiense]